VILGCGYVGERLAPALAALGHEVTPTSRSAARAAAFGPRARVVDPHDAGSLAAVLEPGCVVVDSVPAPHMQSLVTAAQEVLPARVVYLSATSVYGASGWIDEDTPAEPAVVRGRARLAEETLLRTLACETVALRIAAIYGPGRGVEERLRRGDYRVVGEGATWVSRIHVEDLVAVIIAAGTVAPLVRDVYVVADDEPATVREHADGVAAALGLPPPPRVAPEDASPVLVEMQTADRRVRNRRMKAELGVTLRHPSWRSALPSLLRG
jgi:nucleoside-diphosphate-sugar epimerase